MLERGLPFLVLLGLVGCSADATSDPSAPPADPTAPSSAAPPLAPAADPTTPTTDTPTTGSGSTDPTSGSCADTIRNGTFLLPASTTMVPGAVAIDRDDVFVAASYGGQNTAASRIVRCTTTACAANAPTFGAPNAMSRDIALFAKNGHVYFTQHDPDAISADQTDLVQANADGSGATSLYSLGNLNQGGLGRQIVPVGDKLVVAVGKKNGTQNQSALVAVDPVTKQSTPIPGTTFDPLYAWNVKLASDGAKVAWVLDGAIQVTDLAGAATTTAPPANSNVQQLGYSAGGLMLSTEASNKVSGVACAGGSCASPKDIPGMTGFLVSVVDDQVYFVKSRGACAGSKIADFALVRCSVADAAAGNCTNPTVLSAGWYWANVRQIAISGKKLVAWGNVPVQVAAVDLP